MAWGAVKGKIIENEDRNNKIFRPRPPSRENNGNASVSPRRHGAKGVPAYSLFSLSSGGVGGRVIVGGQVDGGLNAVRKKIY